MSAIRWPDLSAYGMQVRIRETAKGRELVALPIAEDIPPAFGTLLTRVGFVLDESGTWHRGLDVSLRELMATFPVSSMRDTEFESLLIADGRGEMASSHGADDENATSSVDSGAVADTRPADEAAEADKTDAPEPEPPKRRRGRKSTTVLEAVADSAPGKDGVRPQRAKIDDFGEYIGGARKERWAREVGVRSSDIEDWTPEERALLVTKDRVWPMPDWYAQWQSGADRGVLAHIKMLRDAVLPGPGKIVFGYAPGSRRRSRHFRPNSAKAESYVEQVGALADALRDVKTRSQLHEALRTYATKFSEERPGGTVTGCRTTPALSELHPHLSSRVLRSRRGDIFSLFAPEDVQLGIAAMRAEEQGWPAQKRTKLATGQSEHEQQNDTNEAREETSKKSRKRLPISTRPHLAWVERSGNEHSLGRDATPDDFLSVFGFRGGEFGNWLSGKERQEVLNLGYHALLDLACVLDVPPRALSLGGTLAIAFGARGKGRAAAHYEPGRRVINLTRIKGAGSLAHEWAHALDHYIGTTTEASRMVEPQRPFASTVKSSTDETAAGLIHVVASLRTRKATDDDVPWVLKRLCADGTFRGCAVREAEYFRRYAADALASDDAGTRDRAAKSVNALQPFTAVIDRFVRCANDVPLSEMETTVRDALSALEAAEQDELIAGPIGSWLRQGLTTYLEWVPQMDVVRAAVEARRDNGTLPDGVPDGVRERLSRAMATNIVRTHYLENALGLDGEKKAKRNPYWSSNWELFARAFESWVEDRLSAKGWVSQYLVHGTDASKRADTKILWYPTGDDRARTCAAFDGYAPTLAAFLRERTVYGPDEDAELEATPPPAAPMIGV